MIADDIHIYSIITHTHLFEWKQSTQDRTQTLIQFFFDLIKSYWRHIQKTIFPLPIDRNNIDINDIDINDIDISNIDIRALHSN